MRCLFRMVMLPVGCIVLHPYPRGFLFFFLRQSLDIDPKPPVSDAVKLSLLSYFFFILPCIVGCDRVFVKRLPAPPPPGRD